MAYTRLGDLLTSVDVITEEQLQEALELQKGTKKRLGQVLIDARIISEMQLIKALQVQLGVDFVDLSTLNIPSDMVTILPKNLARKYQIVPIKVVGEDLYLAMADPLNFIAIEEAKSATRKHIIPVITTADSVNRTIAALYGNERAKRAIEEMQKESQVDGTLNLGNLTRQIGEDDSQSAPAIRLVNSVIERAIAEKASDIHMEPQENRMNIRIRVDGILHEALTVPKDLQASVIARVKIMCGMDITERRIPQDGRASVRVKMQEVDLRASTLPTVYGEKIVIRLLDKAAQTLTPGGIGLTGENLQKFDKLMDNKQGVILIAGPTGSGKSSTLYTMIGILNTELVNLVTLEDPVEYNMDGVNQVQINEKVGMTFSSGLKSILRQDPDIIAVGEIRDQATAEIAMRAAITGHVVLSTIHTNDALSTLDRLNDLGIEPYMISSAMKGVISQRLLRRVCPHCHEKYTPTKDELEMLGMHSEPLGEVSFYRGKGCPECFGTGYRGRIAVFEILVLDKEVRRALHEGVSRAKLAEIVQASGFVSLMDNCRELVLSGVTTAEEVFRTVSADE
ncbi:MAG: type II/IV secretion system protein [Actinobacteria bacterium]|nr:type II/IV secretion system protein [Actinomycetota bacterium]